MLSTLKKHQKNICVLTLTALLFFLSFLYKIESLPIRHCDEGITAVKAQEMLINNNFLVGTRNFKVDHWGSKPQLTQWLDVIFMKALGMRELSVRLPSILAAFGIFLVFFFWSRYLNLDSLYFLLTCFIFVSIPATIFHIHSYRTGDPDSLMVFFLFLASFQAYIVLFPKEYISENHHLILFCLALFFAFMSKGSQVLLFLPGLAVAILVYRRELIIKFLKGGLVVVALVLCYYLIRNQYQPNYLIDVWNNELGGRFFDSLEGNKHPLYFYLQNFYTYRMPYWALILGGIFILNFFRKKIYFTEAYLITLAGIYLILTSLAGTKLEWYDLPVFPLVSLLITVLLATNLKFIKTKQMRLVIITLLLSFPLYSFGKKIKSMDNEVVEFHDYFYKISYFLREPLPQLIIDRTKFIHNGRDGFFEHVLYYTHASCLNGTCLEWFQVDSLSVGDSVLIHQHEINYQIRAQFDVTQLFEDENIQLLKLESIIKSSTE